MVAITLPLINTIYRQEKQSIECMHPTRGSSLVSSYDSTQSKKSNDHEVIEEVSDTRRLLASLPTLVL